MQPFLTKRKKKRLHDWADYTTNILTMPIYIEQNSDNLYFNFA